MEKSIPKIEKNAIYAYSEKIKQNGMAIVVLNILEDKIEGVKLGLTSPENFSMSKDLFFADVDKGILLFMENLPKFVLKEMKQVYNNNLKKL